MTPRQQAVINFIYSYSKMHGYPPTIREIGDGTGLASSGVTHGHLQRLEKKGYLKREADKPRALTLTKLGIAFVTEYEADRGTFTDR
ncbi:LexA family protein [Paenibacillus puldeungensis]|uniref:LexA family protein n=1 Tax=Paenibacillus puldeungensis TaxID=696536 RepID=A0ABW3S4K6_9BACL